MRNLLTIMAVAAMGMSSVAFAKGSSNVECDQKQGVSAASVSPAKSKNLVDSLLTADSGSTVKSTSGSKVTR